MKQIGVGRGAEDREREREEIIKSNTCQMCKVCKQKSYWLFLNFQTCQNHVSDEVRQSRKEVFLTFTCLVLGCFLCLKKGLLLLRRGLELLAGGAKRGSLRVCME